MSRPPIKEKRPDLPRPGKATRSGLTHTEQLALYTAAKLQSKPVVTHILRNEPDLVKKAEDVASCANWLIFHSFERLSKTLLVGGITCKNALLCAACALRRSSSYTKGFLPVVQHLLAENPEYAAVLITKTVKDKPDLEKQYKQVKKAHSSLLVNRRLAMKAEKFRIANPTVYASLFGGFGSYEFKRGRNSGLWHLHTHEIAFIKLSEWKIEPVEVFVWRKIDGKRVKVREVIWKPLEIERRLRKEWEYLTGDSWVCDVRMIGWNDLGVYNEEELFYAVAEVMGYCLKMQSITPADQVIAYRVLRTHRLIYTYGCFRNVKLPPEAYDLDDTIPEDEPFIELQYRWYQKHFGLEVARKQEEALFRRIKGRPVKQSKSVKITQETSIDEPTVQQWLAKMKASASKKF